MQKEEHIINTLKDISKVITKDNLNYFIQDLKGCLYGYLELKEIEPSIEFKTMYWIDDKKNDIEIQVFERQDSNSIEQVIKDICKDNTHLLDTPEIQEIIKYLKK